MLDATYNGMIQMFWLEGNRTERRINRNDWELIVFIKDEDKYREQLVEWQVCEAAAGEFQEVLNELQDMNHF